MAVFGAPVTAVLVALGTIQAARGRWTALLLLGCVPPVAVIEYPLRIEPLAARRAKGGPGALSQRDLASVWVLHLGVAAGGLLAGFPEAACETAGLMFPGDPVRVRRSSFPGRSDAVRKVVDRWVDALRATSDDAVVFRARTVPVPRVPGQLRYYVALDPITLSGNAVRSGDGWELHVVGRVPVDYPPKASLPLFRTPAGPVRIHEGLFDALEQRGWLFPYTAEWRWTETIGSRP